MGRHWYRMLPSASPCSSPPVTSPTGREIRPASSPFRNRGRSDSGRTLIPTGMVNTKVQPNMAEAMMPENRPISGSNARSMAS